jgi:hypothetical protein
MEAIKRGPHVSPRNRMLRAGSRVILSYDDGTEERRTVTVAPHRIKAHDGPRWVIYLDGNLGWFDLRRVRPADH